MGKVEREVHTDCIIVLLAAPNCHDRKGLVNRFIPKPEEQTLILIHGLKLLLLRRDPLSS